MDLQIQLNSAVYSPLMSKREYFVNIPSMYREGTFKTKTEVGARRK